MEFKDKLNAIKAFVLDVDGVLTDGSVILHESGEQVRRMNIKDGYALQLAVKKAYGVAVISGGRSEAVRTRFKALGVEDVYLGAANKLHVFENYMRGKSYTTEDILYMGDDIPDYDIMRRVGLPCCPADAAEQIRAVALYISKAKGGNACVREVIELVMKQQGNWFEPDEAGNAHEEFLW